MGASLPTAPRIGDGQPFSVATKAGVYAYQRGSLTLFSVLKEKLNALLIYAGQRRYLTPSLSAP